MLQRQQHLVARHCNSIVSHFLLNKYSLQPQFNFSTKSDPKFKKATYFDILEISTDATKKDIKEAFYIKAKLLHPDVCRENMSLGEANTRFIELKSAYDTLTDPVLRLRYLHNMNNPEMDNIDTDIDIYPQKIWKKNNKYRDRELVPYSVADWGKFTQDLEDAMAMAYHGPFFSSDEGNAEYPVSFEAEERNRKHIKSDNQENLSEGEMIMHIVSGRQFLGSVNYDEKMSKILLNEKIVMLDNKSRSFKDIDSMFYDSNGNRNDVGINTDKSDDNREEKKNAFQYLKDVFINPYSSTPHSEEKLKNEQRDSDGVIVDCIDTLELNWQGNVTARGIRKNNTIYFEIKKGKNDIDYESSKKISEKNMKDDYDRHSSKCQSLNGNEDFVCFDIEGGQKAEDMKETEMSNDNSNYNGDIKKDGDNNQNKGTVGNDSNYKENDHENDDMYGNKLSFRLIGSLQWVKGRQTNRLRNILCNSKGEETHTIIRNRTPGVQNMFIHSAKGYVEYMCTRAWLPDSSLWFFKPRDNNFDCGGWYFEHNRNGYQTRFSKNKSHKNSDSESSSSSSSSSSSTPPTSSSSLSSVSSPSTSSPSLAPNRSSLTLTILSNLFPIYASTFAASPSPYADSPFLSNPSNAPPLFTLPSKKSIIIFFYREWMYFKKGFYSSVKKDFFDDNVMKSYKKVQRQIELQNKRDEENKGKNKNNGNLPKEIMVNSFDNGLILEPTLLHPSVSILICAFHTLDRLRTSKIVV